jgi:hypothetical protein
MSGTSEKLFDYCYDSEVPGDMRLSHSRTDAGGKTVASTQWEILWDAPPDYLAGEQIISIDVEHKVIESNVWVPPALFASFDSPDMLMGSTSSTPNKFHQPNGSEGQYRDTREEVYNMKAVMTTEFPIAKGTTGDRMSIYINFGEGYGMRYTYEWK